MHIKYQSSLLLYIIRYVLSMIKIRNLREDHDLKQKDIAKLLNCTQQTYSRYETGENNIDIKSLIILADFYNTSIDYIVGRTNEEKPYPK